MTDVKAIHTSIRQVADMGELLNQGYIPGLPENLGEMAGFMQQLDKEGMMLYEDELQKLHIGLNFMQDNYKALNRHALLCPELFKTISTLQELTPVLSRLSQVLDKEGKIRPDASPALWKISKEISVKEREVRKVLQAKFEMARKQGWAGDTEITIRNERLVIPIIAEHKKKIPGFVHDDSQSGKFLYIEPLECFEGNNLLKELMLERKKEIENILREVTAAIAPYKLPIHRHIQYTAFLDTTLAKHYLSKKIDAREPIIAKESSDINLINARHPLLYILLRKDNRNPVPLNFNVKDDTCMVIISGPNAGGKSIALKTIGLLQYMYQCGMPVPLDEGSRMAVFRQIFIDIGDNQSLENNLSSYSSHLVNMKYFMEHADAHTLYLVDELGNGTDPAIGSAIAQAILEVLLSRKGLGVITTHFGNLKAWASQNEGVQNARMLYDLEHLEPLFRLELDKPGSSFALEVAGKVGINPAIIESARKVARQKQHIDLDALLAENEKHKQELADTKVRVQEREKFLERLISDYSQLKDALQDNRQSILNEAKSKASQLIDSANKRIEQTIRVIQENKAEKKETQKVRKQLDQFREHIKPEKLSPARPMEVKEKAAEPAVVKPFAVGSIVRQVANDKVSGEILKIKKDQAQVLFGHVTMWLPLSDLQHSKADKKHTPKTATFNADLYEKQNNFRAELDLRGVRGEEAIEKLDNWLHDAHLLGMLSLKIIHGRGHGILRKLITDHLKSLKFVEHFEHETEQLGGDGVTLVRIN